MAALTITWTAGSTAGSQMRALAKAIQQVAAGVPDVNSTGASVVLTITAPDTTDASVQVTGGPYQSSKVFI